MEDMKDIVHACIDLVPVPVLKEVFRVFKWVWDTVKATKSMRKQLFTLSGALAHLLQTLDREHRARRLGFENADRELAKLKWSVVNACSVQYQRPD